MNDPIGDLITRIRNAQERQKSKVSTPGSKLRERVLEVLKSEGYIRGYSTVEHADGRSELEIELKYFEGRPVIAQLKRISRSGLRQYRGKDALPKVLNGLGVAIVSTSKGIMTDTQARQQGVGGEVLLFVA